MKRNIILVGIIIIIVLVGGWYLLTHKSINYEEIYKVFIKDKKYLNNYDKEVNGKVYYAYYDIDVDKVPELIITLKDGKTDFETNLIYRIKDEKVSYVGKAYHYGDLVYDIDAKSIIYSSERHSLIYGYVYQYYEIKDGRLKNTINLITEINGNEYKYYINTNVENKKEITKEEVSKYMTNITGLTYTEIK